MDRFKVGEYMAETLDLHQTQKQIAKIIDDNPGIRQKEITEEIELKPSSVSHNIDKLKDAQVVTDTELGNGTRYEVKEDVDIDVNLQLEKLLDKKVAAHFLEIMALLALNFYYANEVLLFISWTVGFLPSFILSLSYIFNDVDWTEINVERM